jgi:hypothetical protein
MAWQFHLAIYGTRGMDQAFVTFSDRYTIFKATAATFVAFARERSSPVPIEQTLEIVRLLEAVRDSRQLDALPRAHQHDGQTS